MFQIQNVVSITSAIMRASEANLPQLPQGPTPDPELVQARERLNMIRDHCLMTLNTFALRLRPLNEQQLPTTALQPREGVDRPNWPYYTQYNQYTNQYNTRAGAFTAYFGALDRFIPGSPVPQGETPESVFGAYDLSNSATLSMRRNNFIQHHLATLDRNAGAVDRVLGDVSAQLRNHNPNLGMMPAVGGWRNDNGLAAHPLPGNQTLHVRFAQGRFEYAITATGTQPANNAYRPVSTNPPVVLRHPNLAANHPTNYGSAGTEVNFTDPTTGRVRPLRLMVAMSNPNVSITHPDNRAAYEASVFVDALRQGKSIRQASFAVRSGLARIRCEAQLGEYYDLNRAEFVVRRTRETRQDNVVQTILAAGGVPIYEGSNQTNQSRTISHYELTGNLTQPSNHTICIRYNRGGWLQPGFWEWRMRDGLDNQTWTRLDAPNGATFAPGVDNTAANRIRGVLERCRAREHTPLGQLTAMTATVRTEANQGAVALRLHLRDRILNNPDFGFVPNSATNPTSWSLDTGDCWVQVFQTPNGLRYRMSVRNSENRWSPVDPPGPNGRELPDSPVAIPHTTDGSRNPIGNQQAHIHNLLHLLRRSTGLYQDIHGLGAAAADINGRALWHSRIGNSGDPARDLLVRVFGATVPMTGGFFHRSERYGPGVLQVTFPAAGNGETAQTLLLRRRFVGQEETGFGLWEAARVPTGTNAPVWIQLTRNTPAEQLPPWAAANQLALNNQGNAPTVRALNMLRLLTRFDYSEPFTYDSPGVTPRTGGFHPITLPVRAGGMDPIARQNEAGIQGRTLLSSAGIAYTLPTQAQAQPPVEILAAANFNPQTGGPARLRYDLATRLWQVNFGNSNTWIPCGQQGSYILAPPNASPAIQRANALIYLLGEFNQAARAAPRQTP